MVCHQGQTIADLGVPRGHCLQENLDPGHRSESNLVGCATFTTDDQRVLLTNRATAKMTILDAPAAQAEMAIDAGSRPTGIAVTDNFAIITRSFSDSVAIIQTSDLSVVTHLPS